MAPPPQLKALQHRYCFSKKLQYPSDSTTSMKIKAMVQAHILPHVCHLVRTIAKAKSLVADLVRRRSDVRGIDFGGRRKTTTTTTTTTNKKKKKKKLLRSIRVCCSCPSSHVLPMPEPSSAEGFEASYMYYDSTWNSVIPTEECGEELEPQLSGYLQWLEEKKTEDAVVADDEADEIDRLAEKFIAKCHEKFRLEKQESYRRYQEMLARSI